MSPQSIAYKTHTTWFFINITVKKTWNIKDESKLVFLAQFILDSFVENSSKNLWFQYIKFVINSMETANFIWSISPNDFIALYCSALIELETIILIQY